MACLRVGTIIPVRPGFVSSLERIVEQQGCQTGPGSTGRRRQVENSDTDGNHRRGPNHDSLPPAPSLRVCL